jgi:type I restriction enzyme S subunit
MKSEIPQGWSLINFNNTCYSISLNGIKIKQKQYLQNGRYPVIDQGQELIGGYYDIDKLVVEGEPPFIIFGDHTKVKKFVTFKFIAGADGVKVLKTYEFLDPKLFFHFLHCIKLPDKGYARHYQFLSKAEFPIPPLPEQHRIVAKIEELFSSLDKGIESLKKAQEQLKIYRQAVLKWAFEGRFTNPNVKEGELPEGWVWSNVHEASISMKNGIYRSSDIYSNDGVACLRMYNIEDGKVIWFDIKRMKLTKQEIEQYQLSEGDLLVNRVNSRDLVGKTAYINKYDEPIVYESKNIRLRLKKDISGQYMNYWFLLSANKYFTSNAQQTVGMASINQKQLGDFKFPLPPTLSEQNLIVQEIEKRLSVADKLEESIATAIQQAEALRQSILKKAFEGKLLSEAELEECRNDPNWEPASVLLERIASAKLSIKRAERHNKTSQDKNKPAKNRVKS